MGCCASSDNTEKPSEMRQGSKIREDKNVKNKNNSFVQEETPVMSSPQKVEASSQGGKVPRLDMSKVINNTQNPANKPRAVHAKPDEPAVKDDQAKPKEDQAKPLEAQAKINGQVQQKQDPSQTIKDSGADKKEAPGDRKVSEPAKDQKANGTLVNKTVNQGNDAQKKKEESTAEPEKKTVAEKKPEPEKKMESTQQQEEDKNEDLTKAPEMKKTPSTFKMQELKVSPDIFVSLKTGSINDVYKTGQVLGEGAYGKVSTVTHRTTGIVRAMKSIKKKSVLKEEAEKLFAEVSILKELDHPNIVKLYELFQDNECYYLVTEFCNGGELFDRIQQMQSFTEKQASEYMKQILSAVVYCHSKNIVHRDLKPENLLLDSKKPDAALKVIDFGTSKKFETGKKMTQKFGTPYYIAPEVLSKSYDEKCDVWSCGVILYILLCGYPPFNGRNDAEIISRVKTGKFAFDDAEWSRISNEAKSLIKKMLTLDPAHRISAKEALEDPWMTRNAKTRPLNKKILENLSTFSSKNKLKQAIMTFIVSQITTQQEREELQKTFQSLDKDGNGILTREELVEGYIKVFGSGSKAKAEAEATKIIQEVDVNGSGEIDFSEFIMAAMNKEMLLSKQKVAQAFRLFDQNGDGFITKQELAAVMGGIELDDEEWKQIISEVDLNNDGKISQDEFFQLLMKNNLIKKM